jgi:outer membrane protein TolC
LVLGLTGLGFAGAASAEPWNLERVLRTVREHHPGARAARAAGDAGRAAANAELSVLSPRLALEANASRTDDPAALFTQRLRQGLFTNDDFALDRLNDPDPRSALEAGLVLDVPLWNGGAEVTAPAVASHLRRAASGEEDAGVAATLLRAVETYVEAVRARDAVAADSVALAAAAERRRIAVELYRHDLVPEVDTLRAAASWGEVRVAALDGIQRANVAVSRLSLLVGEAVAAADLAGLDPVEPIDAGGDSSRGVGARGELRAANAHADHLRIEGRRAGLRLLPSLNVRSSLVYYRPWNDGDFESRWGAGLALSLPLWDGTARFQEWRLARARAVAARAEGESLARDLEVAAIDAREAARVANERRDVARAARAASDEALRLATQRYHAGLMPMGELLAADAEAARARHRQIDAESDVVLATYRVLHAMGELR